MLWNTFERIDKYYSKICKLPQRKLSPETLAKLPHSAGVYVVYYKNKPLYVGRSNNVRRRFLQQHLSLRNEVASSSFRKHLLSLRKVRHYKDVRGWILKKLQN